MIDSIWVNESAICCHQNGDKQHTSDDRSSYNCHRPLSNGAVHGLSQTHRLHDTNELGHDLPKVVTKFEVENDNKFYNGRKRQRDIDHDHDVVGQAHQSPDKQSHLPRYERTGYQMRKKDVQIRFDCTQCLTCFSTQSDLLLHERVHHGYFECPQTKNSPAIENRSTIHTFSYESDLPNPPSDEESLVDEFVDDFMSDFDERFINAVIEELVQQSLDESYETYLLYIMNTERMFENQTPDEITITSFVPDLQFKSEIDHF